LLILTSSSGQLPVFSLRQRFKTQPSVGLHARMPGLEEANMKIDGRLMAWKRRSKTQSNSGLLVGLGPEQWPGFTGIRAGFGIGGSVLWLRTKSHHTRQLRILIEISHRFW